MEVLCRVKKMSLLQDSGLPSDFDQILEQEGAPTEDSGGNKGSHIGRTSLVKS